jgi:hypothetical protein
MTNIGRAKMKAAWQQLTESHRLTHHVAAECTIVGTAVEVTKYQVILERDFDDTLVINDEDQLETVQRMWLAWWCDDHDRQLYGPEIIK